MVTRSSIPHTKDNRIFDRGTIVIIVNVVNAASYPTTVWTKAIAVMA